MTPYYQDDAVTLYHGDCLEVLPTLGEVDHVITDPPYGQHIYDKMRVTPGGGEKLRQHGGDRTKYESYRTMANRGIGVAEDFLPSVSTWQLRRWCIVWSDIEFAPEWRTALTGIGLEYIRTGIWSKSTYQPQISGDRPAQSYEAATICHPPGKKKWNGGGHGSVWTHPYGNVGKNRCAHPCPKPLSLMKELVSLFTDPGEVILDPFAGSGTTLRAAKDLGRKAIGIEINKNYCDIAVRRLSQEVLL